MKPDALAPAAKVTVREVAAAAGVSLATVSRVLNRPDLVTASKRAAVTRALAELDYIPNLQARSLLSGRSRAVGLLVPTITNPVFATAIEAIEGVLDAAGHALLIHCSRRDPLREMKQARHLIERGADGLIVTGANFSPDLIDLLERNGMPYMLQDVTLATRAGPSVGFDNAAALRLAVDHLHEQGHRAIAILSGPIHDTPPIADRFEGARARILELELELPPAWCGISTGYDNISIRATAAQLLDGCVRPTAVVCTGEIPALGLVAECRVRGIVVPHALSVVGCGDTDMGQYVDPPLTTVHLPLDRMGETAARGLLSVIAGRPTDTRVVLPHRLVRRQSVAPPS